MNHYFSPHLPIESKKSNNDEQDNSESPQRSYTQEDKELVERVKRFEADYYKVLGIERTANDEDIKKAYRKVGGIIRGSTKLKKISEKKGWSIDYTL